MASEAKNTNGIEPSNGRGSVGRASQAGMLLAAAAVPKSFERTLMPRTTRDQGVVTGMSMALTYTAGAVFQDFIEQTAAFVMRRDRDDAQDDDAVRRATMLFDLLAVGAGIGLQKALKEQEQESLGRAAMRSSGWLLTMAAAAGFGVGFFQDALVGVGAGRGRRGNTVGAALLGGGAMAALTEYLRRRRERAAAMEAGEETEDEADSHVSAARSLLIGGGVTAALAAMATGERVLAAVTGRALESGLPGSAPFWRSAGHAGSLALFGVLAYAGLDRVYQTIEAGTGKIERAFDEPPGSRYVSGSAESLVSWRTMGREGRRHVVTVLTRDRITEVMGKTAVADPIRVFVGLESGRTELERVNLAIQELDRTGAFDRELLIAVSPTGTGYVNYVTIECAEYYTLGNCATVTLQYSKRPSPLSLDRVWEGRRQFRLLLGAIRRKLYQRPPEKRPRLVVFGESLGAHTSQDAFVNQGTQGLEDAGVERALWIGTPHLSKWKAQLDDGRPDVDPSLVADVDSFDEIEEMSSEARERLRYVMITHHNDGVGLFGGDLLIQRPPWLGEPELRPRTVPRAMKWVPLVTAVQTVIDMQNAMNVVPGEFVANGHDYRADLARFVREVFDLRCTDAQLRSVEAALREDELRRNAMLTADHEVLAPGEVVDTPTNGAQSRASEPTAAS
jgi:uncharacterized membrane protein